MFSLKAFFVESKNIGNLASNSLQLEDLNNDVLMEIFNQMEFEDLISFTGTNFKCRELLGYYATYKFHLHEKLIFISSELEYSRKTSFNDASIEIHNYTLFERFSQGFGHLISRIRICENRRDKNFMKSIIGVVNKYYFESLTEISLNIQSDGSCQIQRKNERYVREITFIRSN